ncbi:MAG TPA: SWIM zinc finger family protein [Candidatus Bathyarchaeota archaeon]|nr:SWIM zinc finger family protein [Candidatus Bathyarchaeota archaeon]HEX69249.1 SWIM zinc finger family protein [Candidatus Bathyarchaeota archaeon]
MSSRERELWIKVLESTPLQVRRRASAYLENVKKISADEWVVLSKSGVQYYVRIVRGEVTCTCPYYTLEKGYCKHICAVAANELVKLDFRSA